LGSPVYIANEDDALMTAIDLEQRKVIAEVPVGVEPEGVSISPDGMTLIATSETSNMTHFIDANSYQIIDNVLVGSRPRYAEFTADGALLWVTSEVKWREPCRLLTPRREPSSRRSVSTFPA
jgi:YVTN family beta-propeller protein